MSTSLLIKNVGIASEHEVKRTCHDVLIVNGVYKEVVPSSEAGFTAPEGCRVIDAEGKLMMPGMFDAHVHFREPGQEAKENIASGCAAAVNGGITGVTMMPNTSPSIDNASVVQRVLEMAEKVSPIQVLTSGCLTKDREGKEMANILGMLEGGVTMLTDDGDAVPNPMLLLNTMRYAKELGAFFASHCEVPELAGPRALNEGVQSYKLGIVGSPKIAEEICISRDIQIAHAAGAHLHIQHVSSMEGLKIINFWRHEMGANVTCEVSPHHLIFNDQDIADFDTHYKMNPPLRTAEDNAFLVKALKEGSFDLIATDHAPHTVFEKAQNFVDAPNGITGLDSAVICLYDKFISAGEFDWDLIVKRYSVEPRKLMRQDAISVTVGEKANFLIFNEKGSTTFTPDYMQSKAQNTPYLNKTLKGSIDTVVLGEDVLIDR